MAKPRGYLGTGASVQGFKSSDYDPAWGYAFAPPADPLKRDAVDPRVVYRDVQIVSNTGAWSYPTLVASLAEMKTGIFINSADLVDDVLGDDRVQATLSSRTGGLFGRPVVHHVGQRSEAGVACMAAWANAWPTFAPQTVLAEMKRWAIVLGFAVAEIIWQTDWVTLVRLPDGTEVQQRGWKPILKPWHPKYLYYRWDIRRYVATTIDGPVVIEPGNGKWLIHAPYGQYRAWMHGSIRAIADKWFIKQLAWRDWARFNERHGLPIIKAKIPAAGDPAQKFAFINAMANLGQEAVAGLPQNVDGTGYDIDLLEARDRAWESFMATVDKVDSAITLAHKGNNLTTEVGDQGAYAAARQHGHTDQVVLGFDEASLALDMHQQASRPFAMYNYGDPELAPWSRWDITPPEDYKANGDAWKSFTTGIRDMSQGGYQLSRRAVAELASKQLGVRIRARDLRRVTPSSGGLGSQ